MNFMRLDSRSLAAVAWGWRVVSKRKVRSHSSLWPPG